MHLLVEFLVLDLAYRSLICIFIWEIFKPVLGIRLFQENGSISPEDLILY